MYKITKSFEFDFGHRIYTQNVITSLSCCSNNTCRRLHGHRGKLNVTIEGEIDNAINMVLDFKNLSFVKKWIDENLDHRFLLHVKDPLITDKVVVPVNYTKTDLLITTSDDLVLCTRPSFSSLRYRLTTHMIKKRKISSYDVLFNHMLRNVSKTTVSDKYYTVTISSCFCGTEKQYISEWNESYVICSFVPTAENLCAAFYHWLNSSLETLKEYKLIDKSTKVSQVEFYETPTSVASYREDR